MIVLQRKLRNKVLMRINSCCGARSADLAFFIALS